MNTINLVRPIGVFFMVLGACQIGASPSSQPAIQGNKTQKHKYVMPHDLPVGYDLAIFAGGCFWCMEKPFDILVGVYSTTSGYTDGTVENPSYKAVSSGVTGHTEAVKIVFDPKKITYADLLDVFWRNIDPIAKNRQFCDAGTQYRSGIYYRNQNQKEQAFNSKAKIEKSGLIRGPIYTELKTATKFYPAEDYHQNFYEKNPEHYTRYRLGCGRDRRLEQLWGKAKK